MSQAQVVIEDLIEGNFRYTDHALERMGEREITSFDISECAQTGTISKQNDGKYKIVGKDQQGEDLTVVCVYKNGVLIITVY